VKITSASKRFKSRRCAVHGSFATLFVLGYCSMQLFGSAGGVSYFIPNIATKGARHLALAHCSVCNVCGFTVHCSCTAQMKRMQEEYTNMQTKKLRSEVKDDGEKDCVVYSCASALLPLDSNKSISLHPSTPLLSITLHYSPLLSITLHSPLSTPLSTLHSPPSPPHASVSHSSKDYLQHIINLSLVDLLHLSLVCKVLSNCLKKHISASYKFR
jgi:hypothetical protein